MKKKPQVKKTHRIICISVIAFEALFLLICITPLISNIVNPELLVLKKSELIFILFATFMFIFAIIASVLYIKGVINRPELVEQVEVVGKRAFGTVLIPSHIVAFKFPDDSIKELDVGYKVFESIQGHDTGKLTYTEEENSEKRKRKKNERWSGRLFISFEKDPKPDV